MKISSQGSKILIFSDVHQNIKKLAKIIAHEKADVNICLGDWFDSFSFDSDADYKSTAVQLKEGFLTKPNNITLFGNHDLHYFFDNIHTECSGYMRRNHDIINEALGSEKTDVINKFHWFLFVDEYLCSHAGLGNCFLPPTAKDNEDVYEYLTSQSNDSNIKIRSRQRHWFYGAGRARGGSQDKGGLVWLDFNHEFVPIKRVKQIFGHTNRKNGRVAERQNSGNYCIDTGLNECVTITNGKFEIKNYSFQDL
jgi:hypothetical protein